MKKKKTGLRLVSLILMIALCVSMFSGINVSAEAEDTEQLTESSELWTPSEESTALSYEGDLPFEELETAVLPEEDNPEIVSDDMIEENGHVNRLWEQEEDMNTVIFQNRDGTKTMYYYGEPVKYKDKDGKVKDKSNKISKTSSGDYTNAENDINTYFPKKIHKNKGIELKYGEYTIEVAPNINGSSGASRQTGHNKYSDPTEYVEYPETFAEDISLRYTPTFQGFKEDIILAENGGINEFTFKLTTNGLSLVENEGAYYLADPLTGEKVSSIGDIVVYDSKPIDAEVEEEQTESEEDALTPIIPEYNHHYIAETIEQDNEYLLTVVVDEDYLNAEDTVYPVVVDPSVSMEPRANTGNSDTTTVDGTEDPYDDIDTSAFVDTTMFSNAKVNTENLDKIYVGNYSAMHGTNRGIARALVKFPNLMSNKLIKNLRTDQITSVKYYLRDHYPYNPQSTIKVYQMNVAWTRMTACCDTAAWNGNNPTPIYSRVLNGESTNNLEFQFYYDFDITSAVKFWKENPLYNYGIMLKAENEHLTGNNIVKARTFSSVKQTSDLLKPFIKFNFSQNISQPTEGIESGAIYYLKNTYNNNYMDVANQATSNNTNIIHYSYTGNENQQFKIVRHNTGYYKLYPQNAPNKVLTLNSSGNVVIDTDTSANNQLWRIDKNNDGSYKLSPRSNEAVRMSVYSIASNGNNVICNSEPNTNAWEIRECKKAIIIVPGVMGTELQLASDAEGLEKGTIVWPPVEGNEDFTDPSVIKAAFDKLFTLQCNTNGDSVYELYVNNDDNYGAFDQYETLYAELYNTYSSNRDVIFFGYDWRRPNSVSGDLLREKINEYDKVVVVAHSMGGLVTSHMLTNTAIRNKVDKVITLGTPFLGSLEMLPVLSRGDLSVIDDFIDNLPESLRHIVKNMILLPTIRNLSVNIPSLYELLPTKKFFSLDNRSYYTLLFSDGNISLHDFESTKEYLPNAIYEFNMDLFDDATERHASLWNGNSHITSSVNTYYICGEGKETAYTFEFYDYTGSFFMSTNTAGDGAVLSYSASMNDFYPAKSYFADVDHNELIYFNHNPNVIGFVKNLINGDTTLTYNMHNDPSITP